MALVFRNGQWVQDDVDVESYRRRMQSPEVQRIIQLLAKRGQQRTARPVSQRRAAASQDQSTPQERARAQALAAQIAAQAQSLAAQNAAQAQAQPVVHAARLRDPYEATTPGFAMMDGARIPVGALSPIESEQTAPVYTGPAVVPPTRSGADIRAFGATDASPTSIAPDIPANDVRALAAQDLVGTDIAIDPLTMGSQDFGDYTMPTQAEMQDWADTSSDLMAAQSMMLLPGLLTAGRGGVEVLGPETATATAGGYAQLPAGAPRMALTGNAARIPISGGGAAALPAPAVAPSAAIRMPYTGSGPVIRIEPPVSDPLGSLARLMRNNFIQQSMAGY